MVGELGNREPPSILGSGLGVLNRYDFGWWKWAGDILGPGRWRCGVATVEDSAETWVYFEVWVFLDMDLNRANAFLNILLIAT